VADQRMTRKQRRLVLIGSALTVLAIAAGLVLNALRDSIVFFSTPTMVAEKNIQPGQRFRLGGLVQSGSLQRGEKLQVKFVVTDGNRDVPVAFTGILPDLFLEQIPCLPSMMKHTCRKTSRTH
jgi:cytochrome c-type biogenesis protein CcmE